MISCRPARLPLIALCLLLSVSLVAVRASAQPTAADASTAAGESSAATDEIGQATTSAPSTSAEASRIADAESTVAAEEGAADASASEGASWLQVYRPLLILVVGIAIVLSLIIVLKINAFIALITAAIVVSLCSPGSLSESISRVAKAFGETAGDIGIVIALAAVIGKCMLDSGAADRIVRAFVGVMGERRAPLALMGSGYVLAVPVFFDTVFYLLVPLARSLHRRTGKEYLKYILAIAAGGAITHTLVPPTPGPLLMASNLNIDLGLMIMAGALVALPAAVAGVVFADLANRIMQTPMRPLSSEPEATPLADDELPPFSVSILPVLLPVVLISANTILTVFADMEHAARFQAGDVRDWGAFEARLQGASDLPANAPERRLLERLPAETQQLLADDRPLSDEQQQQVIEGLNTFLLSRDFYNTDAFATVRLSEATRQLTSQDPTRMREAVRERLNRLLLEDTLNRDGETTIAPHDWATARRRAAGLSDVFGNANFALLLSTVIALWTLVRQRGQSRTEISRTVETSLMSAGVIILITAGGGAFGKMLQQAQIGQAIETLFGGYLQGAGSGFAFMLLGFLIAVVLKIAQGSSTVAMIVGSSMMAAMIGSTSLGFNPVYLATAIGGGSLVGSWMNDSGFWIFAKMGGLTEPEALKSWTVMLVMLGFVSLLTSMLLAWLVPLV